MPDVNGYKTLRERFPIRCAICQDIILPTLRDDNGEWLREAEPYRVTGMTPVQMDGTDKGTIPLNLYGHLRCLGSPHKRRASALLHLTYICQHCGQEITEGDACAECLARMRRESQPGASAALQELMQNLARMRDAARAEPVGKTSSSPSSSRTIPPEHDAEYARQQSYKQATGLLENPERLGVYEPMNEMGVVFMFGQVIGGLNYKMAYMDGSFPDCVMCSPTGQLVRAEMEYLSSNFIMHKHVAELCDLVICWRADRALPVPVLALRDYFDPQTGGFDFSAMRQNDTRQNGTEA